MSRIKFHYTNIFVGNQNPDKQNSNCDFPNDITLHENETNDKSKSNCELLDLSIKK